MLADYSRVALRFHLLFGRVKPLFLCRLRRLSEGGFSYNSGWRETPPTSSKKLKKTGFDFEDK